MGELAVLGVRHHGPGSARSVLGALRQLRPEVLVIEGATELDRVVHLAGQPDMRPPVAAFVYGAEKPRRSMFYPLASFSPEWVAMRWALSHGVPVRFADLPATHSLSPNLRLGSEKEGREGETDAEEGDEEGAPAVARGGSDPIASIAQAAGYDDPERWWEDAIELLPYRPGRSREGRGLDAFASVMALMAEARRGVPEPQIDLVREAAMRRVLRQVVAQARGPVAIVCGAWHAPVLERSAWPAVAADNALLRRLPRFKVEVTWVPWTTRLLSLRSGYGAGVESPGWYEHLFQVPDQPVERWLVRSARLLRQEQMAAPPAAAIEAARLAEALAALRGRPLPGLSELSEASQAVMCGGSPVPMRLVSDRLVVGEGMGAVAAGAPMVPLARDLALRQSRLRLKPSAAPANLVLDLRSPSQLQRSILFHRLALLGVHWAVPAETGRTGGTFKEAWFVQWEPELEVALVVASPLGNTVASAASAALARDAAKAGLGTLCALVESALLADLPDALAALVEALADRSAAAHDVDALLQAIEPLARASRYGTVRNVDAARLGEILDGIIARAAVNLPPATTGIDDQAASVLQARVVSAQRGIAVYVDPGARDRWAAAMASVISTRGAHGLLAGQAARALLDGGWASAGETRARVSQALSPGTPPPGAAAFLEGFLAGEALLLVHDEDLLGLIDEWVSTVTAEIFDDLLPILRRAFSAYEPAERRLIGERARRLAMGAGGRRGSEQWAEGSAPGTRPAGVNGSGSRAGPGGGDAALVDYARRVALARARLVRPVMARVLGLGPGPEEPSGERPSPEEPSPEERDPGRRS